MGKIDKKTGEKIAALINSIVVGRQMRHAAVKDPKTYSYESWDAFVDAAISDLKKLGVPYKGGKK